LKVLTEPSYNHHTKHVIIPDDKCKFNTKLAIMYYTDTKETRTSTVHT